MEITYKKALEIILKFCKDEGYGDKTSIRTVCETVLEEDTVCGDNYCEKCVDCTRGNENE